jgi:poly-gamma-glutamate capsule biosynthesis protein CapA/YwtB (metallophosphatase superfamily)
MTLRIALTGDSILERRLLSRTDPELRPLFDLIRGADIGFTNLEVLPNDFRGDPALESGGSHFGAPSWVLDELTEAGFQMFAGATNHSLDYGVAGLREALAQLERRGLCHAGVGLNLEESRRPAYHTHPNGTVALISCCSTFAKGQEASAQRPDMPGRPGLNPLRFQTMHEVTKAQLATVREVAEQLGLEKQRQQRVQLGFAFPPDDPATVTLGDMLFRAAATPAIRTTAKAADLDGIARWVREARAGADLVFVSLHAHEQGGAKDQPAEFLQPFARRMIKEGADLVVGHGPHLLRGIEIYRGKPIFYSLGNFIGQNELVPRLPSDSYDRFRADPGFTPLMVYRQRTANDTRGFPSDARYWEAVVPVCRFEGAALAGIDLHPVTLGLGEPAHRRGRPRLAGAEDGARILAGLAELSRPFGTEIAVTDGVGRIG